MKKPQHGGKRPNSGRKSEHGPTTVIRVPIKFVERVKKFIDSLK